MRKKASTKNTGALILMLLILIPVLVQSASRKDSVIATPKHYIRPCFYLNTYQTGKAPVNLKRYGDYKFGSTSLGFYFPIYTKDIYKKDSTKLANFHLLVTGNILTARAQFTGLDSKNTLLKMGAGLRAIYNTGGKGVWLASVSPFAAQEQSTFANTRSRFGFLLVYNHMFSERFSLRVGVTKTFLFANRSYLPYLGFRVGKLDKVNFTMQFPRNIALNIPVDQNGTFSVFSRPSGGIYNFRNIDSVYNNFGKEIMFGRFEMMTGVGFSQNVSRNFSFSSSIGFATRRVLALREKEVLNNKSIVLTEAKNTLFINVGVAWRFGKAKKVYNNANMYEVLDLNSSFDAGDNNETIPGSDIPRMTDKQKALLKMQKLQYLDVQDLVTENDLF